MDNAPPKAPPPAIRLHVARPSAPGWDVGDSVALEKPQAHYLRAVMRRRDGDEVAAFNGRDGEWRTALRADGGKGAALEMIERLRPPSAPPDLTLLFAPIKKARTDFIVEKACELGCRRVSPVVTRRTQSDRVNVERLAAHMVEAAEQCGLVFVPEIDPPLPLGRALADWDPARTLVFCDEAGDAPPLSDAAPPAPAAILIGPEGGFDPDERAALRAKPFVRAVSLGPRILRADTAAVAAIAVWMAARGDWST